MEHQSILRHKSKYSRSPQRRNTREEYIETNLASTYHAQTSVIENPADPWLCPVSGTDLSFSRKKSTKDNRYRGTEYSRTPESMFVYRDEEDQSVMSGWSDKILLSAKGSSKSTPKRNKKNSKSSKHNAANIAPKLKPSKHSSIIPSFVRPSIRPKSRHQLQSSQELKQRHKVSSIDNQPEPQAVLLKESHQETNLDFFNDDDSSPRSVIQAFHTDYQSSERKHPWKEQQKHNSSLQHKSRYPSSKQQNEKQPLSSEDIIFSRNTHFTDNFFQTKQPKGSGVQNHDISHNNNKLSTIEDYDIFSKSAFLNDDGSAFSQYPDPPIFNKEDWDGDSQSTSSFLDHSRFGPATAGRRERTILSPIRQEQEIHYTSSGELHETALSQRTNDEFYFGKTSTTTYLTDGHLNDNNTLFDMQMNQVAPKEDENSINNEFLRIVAAIVIQTEVRRYLSQLKAMTRMWAVYTIQRNYCIYKRKQNQIRYIVETSAIKIQACFRAWIIRDNLIVDHYCATRIQRQVRVFLARRRLYYFLENVHKHRSAIQIQACFRGYWFRKSTIENLCAMSIQACWRGYHARYWWEMNKIAALIIQTWTRGFLVQKQFHRMKVAAIKIQSCWKSYDCAMNFMHSMADILIVQSIIRRWLAKRKVLDMLQSELSNETYRKFYSIHHRKVIDDCISVHSEQSSLPAKEILKRWRKAKGKSVPKERSPSKMHPRRARLMRIERIQYLSSLTEDLDFNLD